MTNEKLGRNVTDQVVKFTEFISQGLIYVDDLMEEHDWEEDPDLSVDWIFINWEFFLGRELLGLGGGKLATLYGGRSTRPSFQKGVKFAVFAEPMSGTVDHRSKCIISNKNELKVIGFITCFDSVYGYYSPFNIVSLIEDATENKYDVSIKQLQFYLREIECVKE